MNILFSVQNLGLGGVTTYVLHLAAGLSKRHRVIIYDHNPNYFDATFCSWLPENVLIERVKINTFRDKIIWKINALILKLGFKFGLWEYLKNRHFKNAINKHQIQVITSFDRFSDKIVVEQIKDKIPIVLSMHGSYDISAFCKFPEDEVSDYEKVFRTVKAIIYKADCNIKILEKYANLDNIKHIQKVLHGFVFEKPAKDPLLLRTQLKISKDAFVYGMIGRGVPEKGWNEALIAFDTLCGLTTKDIHFIAIGKSEYLQSLQKTFGKNPRIHFPGYVENSLEWIDVLDVGVLPSYAPTENFTFSVVEYMFCGKPAVTTNHGEISTTIDVGGEKAGILTSLKDGRPDIEQIIQAMRSYLEDPFLYERHKLLTNKAFRKFDSALACMEYEKIFYSVT
jgi:glycosyltransferase involved in cell wall biosynthesis